LLAALPLRGRIAHVAERGRDAPGTRPRP